MFEHVHFRATKIAERVVGLDRDVATLIFGKISLPDDNPNDYLDIFHSKNATVHHQRRFFI
jgi:hypothetical protein